jgi:glycosyltransferase involved in cell wall biosynthesis
LVLSNQYPSYDNLYRNAFVHRRVVGYTQEGLDVDVFCLRNGGALEYREFENVDVTVGPPVQLQAKLARRGYAGVLVHFLDPAMWEVLRDVLDHTQITVWVHGSEVQPWYRRDFNYRDEAERDQAKVLSEVRMAFWRDVLASPHPNLHLVFVSQYFAEEVMEDVGIRLRPDQYSVIHNFIDTDLFAFHPKPADQRFRVLSIRPYASRKYANDLSVEAVLQLSRQPAFERFEFRFIGDGPLFDETLAPIAHLPNVVIERRFLSQGEIAQLHREYGVFLCPTRMDSQGVSRDEAMSSGLVPVTNAVTAIPEFVDTSCGILAPGEDARAMADGIQALASDPALFLRMAAAAAGRARAQCGYAATIRRERRLITAGPSFGADI